MNNKAYSNSEEDFAYLLERRNIPFVREFRFDMSRRYRSDFALLDKHILIEIEGGIYTQGRHVRPKGYENDCEKYNLAARLGWSVYRIPSTWIKTHDKRLLTLLKYFSN